MIDTVDIAEIRKAKEYWADVIARGGIAMLPLFLRLEAEEAAAEARDSALERAVQLAKKTAGKKTTK